MQEQEQQLPPQALARATPEDDNPPGGAITRQVHADTPLRCAGRASRRGVRLDGNAQHFFCTKLLRVQPPYAPHSLEILCTQLFQSRMIVPRRSRHFVAVSVPAHGRKKRRGRCRSGRVGSVLKNGLTIATIRLHDQIAIALRKAHAGSEKPSVQKAGRRARKSSLPSISKPRHKLSPDGRELVPTHTERGRSA